MQPHVSNKILRELHILPMLSGAPFFQKEDSLLSPLHKCAKCHPRKQGKVYKRRPRSFSSLPLPLLPPVFFTKSTTAAAGYRKLSCHTQAMDIKQAHCPKVSRNIPVSLPVVQRCRWHKPPGSQSSWLSPSSSTLNSSLHLFLLLDDFLRIFKTLFTLFIWSQGCREGTGSPQLRCLSSSSSQGRRDS